MQEVDTWEERYRTKEYIFGTEPNAFLVSKRDLLPSSGRALAVADGEGRNGVWLAEQGLDVMSIDISRSAQAKARALAQARCVVLATELVSIDEWSWPEAAFDVIAAVFIQFAGAAGRERHFAGIGRALKPGGLLLLEGYRPKQIEFGTGGPPNAENMYTRELLERSFSDFASVEIAEYDAVIGEGSRHVGLSALIDLVGRK